ncbi:hypothetical protein THAOC_08268 [Thalassiosira oceanica]|uniref:MICOS complex subunit n=1 Tax=Thalassiosira oceanica TaxID=159749 RepID=K0SZE9_THAOC|nr:hypothetical protein THAOC_08268 [Thalassiosira oceanica]|mmetsp:Transcript_36146/g.86163  ORF Transcript_36146/g.86163 Transcript_36146/m.86163 type:complete len:143 (-) Transcript_36146:1123-1551(-)|eukprot:EJK70379.1 hypothetical protein THAOC_08268 [Thalassiosira oceanica]
MSNSQETPRQDVPRPDRSAPEPEPTNKAGGDPLLESIKTCVNACNSTLASFERGFDQSSQQFASRVRSLANQARHVASRVAVTYDQRTAYGPQLITATSLLVGSYYALRRGKIAGVTTGALAGAGAFGLTYGFDNLIEKSRK